MKLIKVILRPEKEFEVKDVLSGKIAMDLEKVKK